MTMGIALALLDGSLASSKGILVTPLLLLLPHHNCYKRLYNSTEAQFFLPRCNNIEPDRSCSQNPPKYCMDGSPSSMKPGVSTQAVGASSQIGDSATWSDNGGNG